MIQRYDVDYCTQHACTCEVVKDDEGGYVEYEDYAALLKLNESLTEELEQYRERIKAAEDVVKLFSETINRSKDSPKEEAWTVWFGGANPVPGKMVEFELLNGYKSKEAVPSDSLTWDKVTSPTGAKIIAYRVVKEG